MFRTDTDRTWKFYGDSEPYYGVLTAKEFRGPTLDDAAREEFFATGKQHIDSIFSTVRANFGATFRPRRSLDFGCGVGRLALPIAQISESTVGVDISESMLKETAKNAQAMGLKNVELALSDDSLSQVPGYFDFVHSFIVFQHIPPLRGKRILRELVTRLNPGGVGALHFTVRHDANLVRRALIHAYHEVPLVYGLRNLVKGRPFAEPLMQMNAYNVTDLLGILKECGAHKVSVQFTETSHFSAPLIGVVLFFQKVSGNLVISA